MNSLKQIRERRGLSLSQLAAKARYTVQDLATLEEKGHAPGRGARGRLATALGVGVRDLFPTQPQAASETRGRPNPQRRADPPRADERPQTNHFRAHRMARGFGLELVSQRSGIDLRTVQAAERGDTPAPAACQRLAETLGARVASVFPNTDFDLALASRGSYDPRELRRRLDRMELATVEGR